MSIWRLLAPVVTTIAMTAGTWVATAAPAEAVGGCPSEKLCLYRSTEYRTLSFTAASTGACFWLSDYGLTEPGNGIMSYVNNLSVKATLWSSQDLVHWYADGTIRSGGFSSDTGGSFPFNSSDKICTGSALPY
ncbi:peptidase inhibitor [Streptomyces sp. DSM 15324]|uniref:peptidase inhibitor n=1 Tax=Streptomyces sp. DSM 15324 TaxID=1739111 RepID=UPI00099E7279|nr:peptidase inhibitor [Streptomyces sp. DSM 15324]